MKTRVLAGAAGMALSVFWIAQPAFSDAPVSILAEGLSDVSPAALATARAPASTYETPVDAVKAGDMAAFVELVRDEARDGDGQAAFSALVLSVDRAAAGDLVGARDVLDEARDAFPQADLPNYLSSWILALEGDGDDAVEMHRSAAGALPGLIADLSLAAMLEGLGREDEALAVYSALTPGEITAPEHQFDPQGLMFGHVQTVVARRTLLLRRLGRIDEAKAVYERLAASQPEQAVRYRAAIESIDTGRGFDDEALTVQSAFARSLADLSLSLYQQKLIRAAISGRRLTGFDDQRSALDQLALLLDPQNEDLRSIVIDGLFEAALYDGVAHVARTAPDPSARLQLSAARALMIAGRPDEAREAITTARAAADSDEAFMVASGEATVLSWLDDESASIDAAQRALKIAENDAERAVAYAELSQIYDHFARHADAADAARAARDLDDTHDRRVMLATALGKAGEINEALRILRTERLARPNDPYMLNSLGYFLITQTDRYEEGYKVLARAVALAENNPYIGDSFGWARYQYGDLDGAKRYVLAARDALLPQTHWEIDDHLGDIYWGEGREDDARAAWRRALTTFPPADVRASINQKLQTGLAETPDKRPLPKVSLSEDAAAEERDI